MIEAGRLMQIPLKDHVIIGKGWFRFLRGSVESKVDLEFLILAKRFCNILDNRQKRKFRLSKSMF
jgi:hypothetical protein